MPDLPVTASFNVPAARATSAQRLAGLCARLGSVCRSPLVYHTGGWRYGSAIKGRSFFVSFGV